jgi:gamma-glutamyl-gamma-aminobutyrate hydrolase PuuD
MLAALTMRITEADGYVERRDSISHDWMNRLAEWNVTPLLLPNRGDPVSMMMRAKPDILILTGGSDIGMTPERDATEKALLDVAASERIAVLGVCRGLQFMNDYCGGHLLSVTGHVSTSHAIRVADDWRHIYGNSAVVNSYHGLAVPSSGLGRGLRPTAWDEAGNIEAFVHGVRRWAGVMWHPERAGGLAADRRLIEELAGVQGERESE